MESNTSKDPHTGRRARCTGRGHRRRSRLPKVTEGPTDNVPEIEPTRQPNQDRAQEEAVRTIQEMNTPPVQGSIPQAETVTMPSDPDGNKDDESLRSAWKYVLVQYIRFCCAFEKATLRENGDQVKGFVTRILTAIEGVEEGAKESIKHLSRTWKKFERILEMHTLGGEETASSKDFGSGVKKLVEELLRLVD